MARPRPASAPVTALLAAGIVAVYGFELAGGVERTCLARGFDPRHPTIAGALGSLFLHASWWHLLGNLAVLVAAGTVVEREVGSARFLALYVLSGLAGAAMHLAVDPGVLVGCSGSLCGLLAVVAVMRPRWLGAIAGFISWNVAMTWTGSVDGASFSAHLGGFSFGAAFVLARLRFARAVAA